MALFVLHSPSCGASWKIIDCRNGVVTEVTCFSLGTSLFLDALQEHDSAYVWIKRINWSCFFLFFLQLCRVTSSSSNMNSPLSLSPLPEQIMGEWSVSNYFTDSTARKLDG